MNNKAAKIVIGEDFVPTESNKELFDSGDIITLFGEECVKLFSDVDFSLINLEAPLADKESPIEKFGANLISPTISSKVIKK